MKKAQAIIDRCFIPKIGFAPMLFLEWTATKSLGSVVVINDTDKNIFAVTFQHAKPSDYIELEKYINSNL